MVGRLCDLPWIGQATYSRFFRRPTVGCFWGPRKALVYRRGRRLSGGS
ncbi:hypothetical protein HMPREF1556_00932 [Porphyromonas sp. oral taxon 278 str. W7784]|nr:hypothetical protein HMPREF1556_00932 [Porphyromonas sp. oral taxon 278 str. W7784]